MSAPDLSLPALLAFVRDQGIAADMTAAFHLVSDPDTEKAAKAESDAEMFAAIAERLTALDEQEKLSEQRRVWCVECGDALEAEFYRAEQAETDRALVASERDTLKARAERAERQRAALLTALKAIARDGCESFMDMRRGGPARHGACAKAGRQQHAQYSADRWCDACIAGEAIAAVEADPPPPAAPDETTHE